MPRIDEYIRRLHDAGADRLVIVSGKLPTLTAEGLEEPVDSEPPSLEEVDAMLREILPDHDGRGEEGNGGRGRTQFLYAAPSGSVDVTARRTDRFAQLIVVPASAATAPTPEAEETPGAAAERAAGNGDAPGIGPAGPAPRTSGIPSPVDGPLPTPGEGPVPASREGPVPSPALEVREDAPALERLFVKMVQHGCSDLHVSAGNVPLFRKDGAIVDLGGEPRLSPKQTDTMLLAIAPERYRKQFEARSDADFAYEIPGVARFRCNLFLDRRGVGGVFRQIPAEIVGADELGLSPQILELCHLRKGLVLVTGPTGSGKSTTLAALIDYINRTRTDHIITIEDPIEFVHENKKCLINQREVGQHTESFKVALRAALREDPDIVLVGELRDLETVEMALETAETGHLVFGTLHTNTAASTVGRLIDQFPPDQQAQIRTMLADTLKAVIAQTLCRRKEGGRVAAMEILLVSNAVANLIREDKTFQIASVMQTGRGAGMVTMSDALIELIKKGVVTPVEAHRHAADKAEFRSTLARNQIALDPRDAGAHDLA